MSEDVPMPCDVCGGTIYPGDGCCDDCYFAKVDRRTDYERGLADGAAMERAAICNLVTHLWADVNDDPKCSDDYAYGLRRLADHIAGLDGRWEEYDVRPVPGAVSSCHLVAGVVDVDLACATVTGWSARCDDDDWIIRW